MLVDEAPTGLRVYQNAPVDVFGGDGEGEAEQRHVHRLEARLHHALEGTACGAGAGGRDAVVQHPYLIAAELAILVETAGGHHQGPLHLVEPGDAGAVEGGIVIAAKVRGIEIEEILLPDPYPHHAPAAIPIDLFQLDPLADLDVGQVPGHVGVQVLDDTGAALLRPHDPGTRVAAEILHAGAVAHALVVFDPVIGHEVEQRQAVLRHHLADVRMIEAPGLSFHVRIEQFPAVIRHPHRLLPLGADHCHVEAGDQRGATEARHLVGDDDLHAGTGLRRLDGRHRARDTTANDQDVHLLVPG